MDSGSLLRNIGSLRNHFGRYAFGRGVTMHLATFAIVGFACAFIVPNAVPRVTRWQHLGALVLCGFGAAAIAHFINVALGLS